MHISKIRITNIRCFKNFEVDLHNKTGTMKWMIALGENGVGKTTLLRCIALGLSEKSGAAGLIAEVPGDWIHDDADSGEIRIDILPYEGYVGEPAYILTTLSRANYREIAHDQ